MGNGHETCGRRDGDKANDGTDAGTEGRHFAVLEPVVEHPRNHRRSARQIGVGKGFHGIGIGAKCRTCVESEPPKPQQPRTEDDERNVGRLVVHLIAFA